MSTTSVVAYSAFGGIGSGAIVVQAMSDVPWDKLAGGSAALLVAGILFFVLKHMEKLETKHSATVEKVTGEFSTCQRETAEMSSTAQKETAQKLADTATIVMRENREASERREQALHQLIRDLHDKKP